MAEGNGNGFEFSAGPAAVKATGSVVINVLLAILVIGAIGFSLYVGNQQNMLIHTDHMAMNQALKDVTKAMNDFTKSNENLFLSTMLPNERKKDLPTYVQDRAREIVERKAQVITEERR